MNELSVYRCQKCGNIVMLLKSGGGTLTCCDQEMTKLKANTVDASQEKHVPALKVEGGKLKVDVGTVLHPMVAEHFIEWIAMVEGNRVELVYLKPGMEPKAEFIYRLGEDAILYTGKDDEVVPNCEAAPCNFVCKDKPADKVVVYEYCNLHGLWKAEL